MLVRYWMNESPYTARETTTLLTALQAMKKHRFRRLPILRGEELCGILSISDLYRFVTPVILDRDELSEEAIAELQQRQVGPVMTPSPITCEPNTPIEDVAAQMRERKIGAMPVVDGGKLVGIITESNVLEALAKVARAGTAGHRVCFKIPTAQKQEVFYRIVELCQHHKVDLTTVLTHPTEDDEVHMVMIRFKGGKSKQLVEALWDSSYQVLKVD